MMMLDEKNTDFLVPIIAGSLLLFLLCSFIVAFTLLYIKKREQSKSEKQQLKTEFAAALSQSKLETTQETLQRIGHELHDNLGQVASLVKIHLNTIKLNDKEAAELKINETKDLMRQLIGDIKQLSLSLSSDRVNDLGIVKSLQIEIERINKLGPFEAKLLCEDTSFSLNQNATTILFRMSQEILNNMVKHSNGKQLRLKIEKGDGFMRQVFTDDGVGFNYEEAIGKGRAGLKNLRSRAKLINALLKIDSTPNLGTRISIEIPTEI